MLDEYMSEDSSLALKLSLVASAVAIPLGYFIPAVMGTGASGLPGGLLLSLQSQTLITAVDAIVQALIIVIIGMAVGLILKPGGDAWATASGLLRGVYMAVVIGITSPTSLVFSLVVSLFAFLLPTVLYQKMPE